MRTARFTYALDEGLFVLPQDGAILALGIESPSDVAALPKARLTIVTRDFIAFQALAAQGFAVAETAGAVPYAAAYVALPRARAAAEALLAQAAASVVPGGLVIVDGARTDGVERLWRDLKPRLAVSAALPKAHGRIFTFPAGPALADWAAQERVIEGGFVTQPGVFSADAPDPGSALLAAALPPRLKGYVVDLGAGWGFLARAALTREGLRRIDLVETDGAALDCARRNVDDPRARFIWADACDWRADGYADHVLCNPPFHRGRQADPGLGLAFIAAAQRILSPTGTLWLVANRHLPYNAALQARFGLVEERAQAPGFRVICAQKPLRPRP